MPKPKGKPLTRKQCQQMHDAYIQETQEFLKPWIQKGATWTQCQQAIEFGDDERDEDVVNPLFPDMDKDDEDEDEHTRINRMCAEDEDMDEVLAGPCQVCGKAHATKDHVGASVNINDAREDELLKGLDHLELLRPDPFDPE